MEREGHCALGIIGAGNTLAGDDGAGNEVVSRLRGHYEGRRDILLYNLESDPLELWDILPRCGGFILIDAIAGIPSGRLVAVGRESAARAYPPSMHHMDMATLMASLCRLGGYHDLDWKIWGVTIEIPESLGQGLSPEVERSVDKLVSILRDRIDGGNLSVDPPDCFEKLNTV